MYVRAGKKTVRIVNLIENTEGEAGCISAHGLSFYIENGGRKILMDLGPSDDTLKNAGALGIDLKSVDTVILSHGHYDHSGGILPFAEINDHAGIYMQSSATGEYYADDGPAAGDERFRYIGIDKRIRDLKQVRLIDGDCEIAPGIEMFTIKNRTHDLSPVIKRGRPGLPASRMIRNYLPVILACIASSSSLTFPPVRACCSTEMTPCLTSFHSALVVG